jgi:hypothetical protein
LPIIWALGIQGVTLITEYKWEFLINGDHRLLRPFSEFQENYYFNVTGGIDHWHDCMNDDFRLTSAYFESEDDEELVWQIGYELISLFNGISLIFDKNFRKLEIDSLLKNEKNVSKVNKLHIMSLLGEPSKLNQYVIEKEFQKLCRSDARLLMVNLATEREDVYLLLKYFDLAHDWVNYYKILESVEAFSKASGISITVDKKSRSAFTNTANNYQFSGLHSRHGFKKTIKENKTTALTLSQAHDFIAGIAKEYLNKVANEAVADRSKKEFRLPE